MDWNPGSTNPHRIRTPKDGYQRATAARRDGIDDEFKNGVVSRNRTEYERCREFTAKSAVHGGGGQVSATAVQASVPPPVALPAGVSLDLRLKDSFHVEQVAIGDLVRFRIEKVTTGDHEIASGDEVIGRVIHFSKWGRFENGSRTCALRRRSVLNC